MTPEWTKMTSATGQIRAALAALDTGLPYSVHSRWVRRQDSGNVITVTELENAQSTRCSVVDRLGYQIDIWAVSRDAAEELTPLVNAAVCGIGFRRTGSQAAAPYRDTGDAFRVILRFERHVDKRFGRLID